MKSPWTFIAMVAVIIVSYIPSVQANASVSVSAKHTYESSSLQHLVEHQFQHLDFPFQAQYTQQVEQIILDYLVSGQHETEKILGRTTVYFPIFEHYLKAYNLPDELKYIPFIESRLKPLAKSRAGATGLWQFMPATAKGYGLTTTEELDERLDPHRSTQAAVTLLAELFEDFGDWSLALAAYNCGPGRVRRAIRKTGCRNFWDIKAFLPKQTQKYIPTFLAAIYVSRNYHLHQLQFKAPHQIPVNNISLKVYQRLSFKEIANICNLQEEVIHKLNPGYTQQFLPASEKGRFIVLPAKATHTLEQYLTMRKAIASSQIGSHRPFNSYYNPINKLVMQNKLKPGTIS